MNLREYDHLKKSPDIFYKDELLRIREALASVRSPHVDLIDKTLAEGHIEPPEGDKPGYHRMTASEEEKSQVLEALESAKPPDFALLKKRVSQRHYAEPWTDEDDWIMSLVDSLESWRRYLEEEPVPWEEAIKTQQYYDVRTATLEDFQDFLFDHDVPGTQEEDPWYFDLDMWIDFDERRNAQLFIDLFHHSDTLSKKFSTEQLDQGLWAAIGINLPGNIHELIWNSDLDIPTTEALIASTFDLFAKLYAVTSVESSCFMFWDMLTGGSYFDDHPSGKNTDSDSRIHDAMFAAMVRILDLDSLDCQVSALHGLGHLQHPDTETAIRTFLYANPDLPERIHDYALCCIRGNIV